MKFSSGLFAILNPQLPILKCTLELLRAPRALCVRLQEAFEKYARWGHRAYRVRGFAKNSCRPRALTRRAIGFFNSLLA